MATYFTHWTTGNDNESAISGATFTESTKNLNKAGAFAAYAVNMRIHVNAGTAVVDGIYKVVTVTDDDNVVLESTITSDASDPTDVGVEASDGLSEGAAFATLNHAVDAMTSGDETWAKHDGTSSDDYLETITIGSGSIGSAAAWITLTGYTSSTGDGGKFTIDGESTRSNGITTPEAAMQWRFENMIIENHTANGFNTTTADDMLFVNCEFNSNATDGCAVDNGCVFINCSATGNSVDGFAGDIGATYINCVAHNNTFNGFDGQQGGLCCDNCIASYNGDSAFLGAGSNAFGPVVLLNCTVDGNAKDSIDGFKQSNTQGIVALVNSIFYDCGDGIDGHASVDDAAKVGLNNLVNGNTTAYRNWSDTSSDITSAPGFVDEGSQDYTLAAGSAAKDSGADVSGSSSPGMDIGAHQSADAGGGVIKMAGDGGGMVG